jgi:phytoene synthase
VAARLLPHVRAYSLTQEGFLEMIRGCAMDLEGTRYQTPEELEGYMRGVASSVGRLAVEIFGYRATPAERMREFATLFGYAFQLTNIIRDVGADLELGRVYIPASDMQAAGYSEAALLRREHNAAFDRLMQALYGRAQTYYRRARSLVDFRDRPALLAAEVMAHIYEALLEDIRAGGFRVLFHRHSLPPWRKAVLAGKAWLYCHGL